MAEVFPARSSTLAAFSHSELKRRTSVSSGTRSPRSLTRSEKAPPASTEDIWAWSPRSKTLEPAVVAALTSSSRVNVPASEPRRS